MEILEMLKKYPELDKVVNEYLNAAKTQETMHLSADASEALKTEENVKPLENPVHEPIKISHVVPEKILDVIKLYPDIEQEVNEYMDTMKKEQELHLSVDAVKMLEK